VGAGEASVMFRRFQQRCVNPRAFRRTFLSADHPTQFTYIIQPVIVGAGIFTVLYVTARYQNIQYNAYKDPHYPPYTIAPTSRHLPEWQTAGLNNEDYYSIHKGAIFSTEFSATTPPAAINNNLTDVAAVIRENPELWGKYRQEITSNGISFLKCIKPGFDNGSVPGSGVRAGDQESYTLFAELFALILAKRNKAYTSDAVHPASNFNVEEISGDRVDESGKYVKSTRVSALRSISGYLLTPDLGFDDRREIEKVVYKCLGSLGDDLAGEYNPLLGSRSIRAKPHGMSAEVQQECYATGQLFTAPTDLNALSAGLGRHWPDGRGLFLNEDKNLFAQLNDEEHIRIIAEEKGDNIQAAASRVSKALSGVESVLKSEGHEFARSEHLGYVNCNPDSLGSGLNVEVTMSIPNLSSHPKFSNLASNLGLSYSGKGDTLTIRNASCYGSSEVDLVNSVAKAASTFVILERALENGENIDSQL